MGHGQRSQGSLGRSTVAAETNTTAGDTAILFIYGCPFSNWMNDFFVRYGMVIGCYILQYTKTCHAQPYSELKLQGSMPVGTILTN